MSSNWVINHTRYHSYDLRPNWTPLSPIRLCHTAAILSRDTKKALFYHAKPHPHGFHCEAWRGKTKLFWSPGTIWPPCDKDEFPVPMSDIVVCLFIYLYEQLDTDKLVVLEKANYEFIQVKQMLDFDEKIKPIETENPTNH